MTEEKDNGPGCAVRFLLWIITVGLLIGGAVVLGLVIAHDSDREWEMRQHWIQRESGRVVD